MIWGLVVGQLYDDISSLNFRCVSATFSYVALEVLTNGERLLVLRCEVWQATLAESGSGTVARLESFQRLVNGLIAAYK